MALIDKITAIADGFRSSRGTTEKLSFEEMAALAAEKAESIPDGTDVTFGNVDGIPVDREEAYAISSEDLNALGRIAQDVAGKTALMTVSEMIYHLNRAKWIPQGYAQSAFGLDFESSAVGILTEG